MSSRLCSLAACLLLSNIAAYGSAQDSAEPGDQPRLAPIGIGRGIHPGRVVWAHDPRVVDWEGPGGDCWWEAGHVDQSRVDAMLAQAVCKLTGESTVAEAWSQLFRHLNQQRGREAGYQPGEKIVIKPNWVGMIWREGNVDPDTYTLIKRRDYMNTAPQMILGVLRQLTGPAGVPPSQITVSDTLSYLVREYYEILHGEFPEVRYEDYGGKLGRTQVRTSQTPLYWSSRPAGAAQDYLPTCFAEASYVINFANLKAHMGSGVTLCAKNHYGSLIRWPVQEGYYNIHPGCFATESGIYRPLVDLMGHADLGGKTVLYLVDALFSGVHPRDATPQRMKIPPFNGAWPCSLLASQDPVAIDSVGFDFLWAEGSEFARKPGVDDYLHEAALAHQPPSGTFYDPNHATSTRRLGSLGVHEHWNNAQEKRYSRNLGRSEGIELLCLTPSG